MARLLAVLLQIAASEAYQPGSPLVEGEVCEGEDASVPAESALRGKHLLLNDFEWTPLAYPDASKPQGWGGVDIDLLDRMRELLGFNYTIRDMGYPPAGATWTDHLTREVHTADATLCWWSQTAQALSEGVSFTRGHMDISLVLLSRTTVLAESDVWYASVYSWSLPFDRYLWVAIVTMIFASAGVDYLVEKHDSYGAFGESLYEYFAGVLWGGYGVPRSSCSAIYQVMVSFIVLILIASYTANLAAFITINAQAVSAIASMDEVVYTKQAICVDKSFAWASRAERTFPRATWIDTSQYTWQGEFALLHDDCQGVVVPKVDWLWLRGDESWCHLHVVEVISAADTAGWATSPKSSCVARAFSWALTKLIDSGDLAVILNNHFPEAACEGLEVQATARRLEEAPSPAAPGPAPAALAMAKYFAKGKPGAARELRAESKKSGTSGSLSGDDKQQMTVNSFVGLFALWGAVSLMSLAWTYCVPGSWKVGMRHMSNNMLLRLTGGRCAGVVAGRPGGEPGEMSVVKKGSLTSTEGLPRHMHLTHVYMKVEEALHILHRLDSAHHSGDSEIERAGLERADGKGSLILASEAPWSSECKADVAVDLRTDVIDGQKQNAA